MVSSIAKHPVQSTIVGASLLGGAAGVTTFFMLSENGNLLGDLSKFDFSDYIVNLTDEELAWILGSMAAIVAAIILAVGFAKYNDSKAHKGYKKLDSDQPSTTPTTTHIPTITQPPAYTQAPVHNTAPKYSDPPFQAIKSIVYINGGNYDIATRHAALNVGNNQKAFVEKLQTLQENQLYTFKVDLANNTYLSFIVQKKGSQYLVMPFKIANPQPITFGPYVYSDPVNIFAQIENPGMLSGEVVRVDFMGENRKRFPVNDTDRVLSFFESMQSNTSYGCEYHYSNGTMRSFHISRNGDFSYSIYENYSGHQVPKHLKNTSNRDEIAMTLGAMPVVPSVNVSQIDTFQQQYKGQNV